MKVIQNKARILSKARILLCVLVTLVVTQSTARAVDWFQPILLEEQECMVQIRLAGVNHDTSQVPFLIKSLQNPLSITTYGYIPGSLPSHIPTTHSQNTDNLYRLTLMQALARLGAVGAVPAMDDIIQSNKDPEVVLYASVCKARLLAESSVAAKGKNTPKQLTLKIERFLQELNLTAENINGGVTDYQAQAMASRAQRISDGTLKAPLELFALREIADIVYRDASEGIGPLPILSQIDFSKNGYDLSPENCTICKVSIYPKGRILVCRRVSSPTSKSSPFCSKRKKETKPSPKSAVSTMSPKTASIAGAIASAA